MITVLGLEAIGDDRAPRLAAAFARRRWADVARYLRLPGQPWVARITGRDPRYGLAREFVQGQRDYAEASSTGARGIVVWYQLEDGGIYEIHELLSWKRDRRYFCRARRGQVVEITREEVERCL